MRFGILTCNRDEALSKVELRRPGSPGGVTYPMECSQAMNCGELRGANHRQRSEKLTHLFLV